MEINGYKSKFDIGQSVFMMDNNQIVKLTISGYSFFQGVMMMPHGGIDINPGTYGYHFSDGMPSFRSLFGGVPEPLLYATEDELIASIKTEKLKIS